MSCLKNDWWIWSVVPLAAAHVLLFLTLVARPGRIAITLWQWGPPALAFATSSALVLALASAFRGRHTWSWRRATSLTGLCGIVASMGVYQTFPSSHDSSPSAVDFRLPLEGPLTVAWGGPRPRMNHHVSSPAERWGYDLLVTLDGRSHRGDGRGLADYYAYDRVVRAPAAGKVVAVHDGTADASPGRPDPRSGGGNRIVVEVGPGQHLFIAHLRAGSIPLVTGQSVRQGDLVGRVGNSGNSSEPHVHLHLQDTPFTDEGEGIPFSFSNYVHLNSGTRVTRGAPQGGVRGGRFLGDIVQSLTE